MGYAFESATHEPAPIKCKPLGVFIKVVLPVFVSQVSGANEFWCYYPPTGFLFTILIVQHQWTLKKIHHNSSSHWHSLDRALHNVSCLIDLSWKSIIIFMGFIVAWPKGFFAVCMVNFFTLFFVNGSFFAWHHSLMHKAVKSNTLWMKILGQKSEYFYLILHLSLSNSDDKHLSWHKFNVLSFIPSFKPYLFRVVFLLISPTEQWLNFLTMPIHYSVIFLGCLNICYFLGKGFT